MSSLGRRLPNEIRMLDRERESHAARGIYVHVHEDDMRRIDVLIVPKHRADSENAELQSPYTGGPFLFEITVGDDYPMEPPGVAFQPQQHHVRLHPNMYESGKVCLSIINTWGAKDWAPSMSLLALINTLDERFGERCLCFEPSRENSTLAEMMTFNAAVEMGKLQWVVLPVMATAPPKAYAPFAEALESEFRAHYDHFLSRLGALEKTHSEKFAVQQIIYGHDVRVDTRAVREGLATVMARLARLG